MTFFGNVLQAKKAMLNYKNFKSLSDVYKDINM